MTFPLQPSTTSQTDASNPSYEAASRPLTATPSSSAGAKPTPNEDNVRAASAKQGMFFEDEDSYERYPDFKARVEQMVFGERGSAMRVESLKNIKTWRVENATKDEKSFFATMKLMVIKSERDITATNKRTFQDEIVYQAKSFKSDGLDEKEDCLFVKHILPLRTTYAEAAHLGVTTAKPDFVYGLHRPRFPNDTEPALSAETVAHIEVAPGLQHAFFSVDNKGSQHSIEAAENQAMRSGATMVAARRILNRKANGKAQPLAITNAIAADTITSTDTIASDASVAAANATANTIALGLPASESKQEDLGADINSYAFTCSWVPQMANIHVHWCERRPGGSEVYHMNLLRGYLMSDDGHVADFRKDVHNILDWGVDPGRKTLLKQLERDIAKYGG